MPELMLVFPLGLKNTENVLIYATRPAWDVLEGRQSPSRLVYPGDASGVLPPLSELRWRIKLRALAAAAGNPWAHEILSTAHPDSFTQNTFDRHQLDITAGPALKSLGVPPEDYQGALDMSEDGETWLTHLYPETDVVAPEQVWLTVRVT